MCASSEDHVALPRRRQGHRRGDPDLAEARPRAAELLETVRPAGVRILHNLAVVAAPSRPPTSGVARRGPRPAPRRPRTRASGTRSASRRSSRRARATLTADQKSALARRSKSRSARSSRASASARPIVYNRLVAAIIAVDGVYDVSLDLPGRGRPERPAQPDADPRDHPPPPRRPRRDAAGRADRARRRRADRPQGPRGDRRSCPGARGRAHRHPQPPADAGRVDHDTDQPGGAARRPARHHHLLVEELAYTAEFLDEGLRITATNKEIQPGDDQEPWVRAVNVTEAVQST